ncbi:gamma-glutamylcyclotransferase family protein [Marinobacter sp. CHS3-4]|uniref:gamma-glutamylcyclotransferase family protein n=1 Tax=Marinobacter sp. CHS3-4 TaxID=3045174 RepID=UPI0024B4ECD0|nr:gamma-glutamylcyclotransferase family protein [Marinobacter sp. CHS3-4]MDI9244705.1 gamma-glutamylcyclotransferase family protein [Marinobacter sp. CHS3-4]
MSMLSLKAKGVEPEASWRAELPGWRLRFNVEHFFQHEGGVGNIECTDASHDRVLGLLHLCHDNALELLDAAEAYGHGYDRIEVEVIPDEHVPGESDSVSALTYVGMPQFINNHCRPSQRYLNIVLDGARQAQLDEDYIQDLAGQPIHEVGRYPAFSPPEGDFPIFDKDSLAKQPHLTALYGAVFDMSQARSLHDYLKSFFGGRDMTLFHLKRLDSSSAEETIDDIRNGHLDQTQQRYLNTYLNEYAREYRYVGRYSYHKD